MKRSDFPPFDIDDYRRLEQRFKAPIITARPVSGLALVGVGFASHQGTIDYVDAYYWDERKPDSTPFSQPTIRTWGKPPPTASAALDELALSHSANHSPDLREAQTEQRKLNFLMSRLAEDIASAEVVKVSTMIDDCHVDGIRIDVSGWRYEAFAMLERTVATAGPSYFASHGLTTTLHL